VKGLMKKYLRFSNYQNQGISDIFTREQIASSLHLKAFNLSSNILLNEGGKKFIQKPLPAEAQFSPIYALLVADFNKDGREDILLGGNQSRAKPETGIYKASYGLFLKGMNGGKWESVSAANSGFFTKGEIRDLKNIKINEQQLIVVARNNTILQFYKNQ